MLQTVLSSDAVGVFGATSPVRGGQVETAAEHVRLDQNSVDASLCSQFDDPIKRVSY